MAVRYSLSAEVIMHRLGWKRFYSVTVLAVVCSLLLNSILPAVSFSATVHAETQSPQNSSGESQFVVSPYETTNTVREQQIRETSLRTLAQFPQAQRVPAPSARRTNSVPALGANEKRAHERPAFSSGPRTYTNTMSYSRGGNCGG